MIISEKSFRLYERIVLGVAICTPARLDLLIRSFPQLLAIAGPRCGLSTASYATRGVAWGRQWLGELLMPRVGISLVPSSFWRLVLILDFSYYNPNQNPSFNPSPDPNPNQKPSPYSLP